MKRCEILFNRISFTCKMVGKETDYFKTLSLVNKYLKQGKARKTFESDYILMYTLIS